jgi:hypothetical protein
MTELRTFTYEAFVGKLENGQRVLVQIFRNLTIEDDAL